MKDNKCISCEVIIPEGRQVCPNCEEKIRSNKMKDKLKPCPFCGSEKVILTRKSGYGISTASISRIECKKCGLKTRLFYDYEKVSVEEYWNRSVNKNER